MKKHFLGSLIIGLVSITGVFPQTSISASSPANETQVTTTREKREQAYAKLLEGQRYIWKYKRSQSKIVAENALLMARQSLRKAVELDPKLAEGYTALADVSISSQPADIEEAILLAGIAVRINPDNLGGHRILARLYTIKSRLNGGILDSTFAVKAVAEWKEVARLDPRNAEAWAFLSIFYGKTGQKDERIKALRNWTASATPTTPFENRFYRQITGAQDTLAPDSATLKLGEALLEAGKYSEALELISLAVADEPENQTAVDLLRQVIYKSTGQASAATVSALRQAVYANPSNPILTELLVETQIRAGKSDEAVKIVQTSIATAFAGGDKNTIANLQVSLGDVYGSTNRSSEAIAAYEEALKTFGITNTPLNTDEEREFAVKVFGKIIQVYKNAGRIKDAKAAIERARLLLGKSDLFADKQLVNLLRESGNKDEALRTIRAVRRENPEDYGLMRLEASTLTENGRVEEGVSLIKKLITGNTANINSPFYDNFVNYIFISGLYSQAGRNADAAANAQLAYKSAQNDEMRQIADMSFANAKHQSGDFKTAETILRNILKKTPQNPIALNNLGYFLLDRNDRIQEAHDLIEKALSIDPTNDSYLDSFGWAKFKLGKYDDSEKFLKEAIRRNPYSSAAHEHLGDVYNKQGKQELARSFWQKALTLAAEKTNLTRIKTKLETLLVKQ